MEVQRPNIDMKTFTSLLIGCSLALAGVAIAQQPNEESSPGKKKKQGAEQAQPAEAKPRASAAKPHATAVREHGAQNAPGATNEPGAGKGRKAHQESATAQGAENTVSGQPAASATPGAEKQRKGMKGHAAKTSPAPAAKTSPAPAATAAAAASATPAAAAATQQKGQANVAAGAKKKPDPQKVQQIKAQHASFRAQPKPQQVPAVTFNQSYRIQGSERWQGPQYEVFRAYRPERHDEGWYRSRYSRVELIGGGYYYWNRGYWYPAWGYSPSAEYYAYDGPIYVGQRAEPPDQVIADVQAELQEMGYYRGEVDGLLGPMTREALTAYQADQGLTTTAVIDEPTLDSLGLAS
jgi:Putative peptidoglycan binding domain